MPTVAPDGTVYVAFRTARTRRSGSPARSSTTSTCSSSRRTAASTGRSRRFVAGPRGRLERLPDQRRRPPDAHRLPGARQLGRQHRREPDATGRCTSSFSDNRNGIHDSDEPGHEHRRLRDHDSTNGGKTWTTPSRVDAGAGDQWFPWVGRQPGDGQRSASSTTTAVPRTAPTLQHGPRRGHARLVRRRRREHRAVAPDDSVFFQAGDPGVRVLRASSTATTSALAYGTRRPRQRAWTDMRDPSPFTPGLFSQFIYYARR